MLKNKIRVCDPVGENIIIKDAPMATFIVFIILVAAIICYSLSCVSPEAVKTDAIAKIASVENNLNKLEKIVDNKVNANEIDNLRQQLLEINNTVNNSGIIKYNGAGWVIISSSSMVIIFLLAIFLSIKYFLKANKTTNMLGLVVQAVKNSSPEIGDGIKAQIKKESSNGGKFNMHHRDQLRNFVENNN